MIETLRIENLYKSYGNVDILKGLNITVHKGEFISLLGPSGCGKTTLLRIIAGLTDATSGKVIVEGKDMGNLPPYKRNNGMVFQNYALFPHMNVHENIAFGLKMKGIKKSEIEEKVKWGLSLIHLENLGRRYPKELSGGQQQRVALIRALVLNPTLLLLDEPLCNLDAKLRKEMRIEIRKIQQQLNVTTIFVTHDQEEALTMSDRIAVINAGRFEQIGKPTELYENPQTRFVAGFIGTTNLFDGQVAGSSDKLLQVRSGAETWQLTATRTVSVNEKITFSVRPERAFLARVKPAAANSFACKINTRVYLGSSIRFLVADAAAKEYSVDVPAFSEQAELKEGETAFFCWQDDDALIVNS